MTATPATPRIPRPKKRQAESTMLSTDPARWWRVCDALTLLIHCETEPTMKNALRLEFLAARWKVAHL